MEPIENEILTWIINNFPEFSSALTDQINHSNVKEREFSSGGGVFVSFSILLESQKIDMKKLEDGIVCFHGPFIKSPELECDASASLHINEDGLIDYLEILSHASDYPHMRHVNEYQLVEPKHNIINDL